MGIVHKHDDENGGQINEVVDKTYTFICIHMYVTRFKEKERMV